MKSTSTTATKKTAPKPTAAPDLDAPIPYRPAWAKRPKRSELPPDALEIVETIEHLDGLQTAWDVGAWDAVKLAMRRAYARLTPAQIREIKRVRALRKKLCSGAPDAASIDAQLVKSQGDLLVNLRRGGRKAASHV